MLVNFCSALPRDKCCVSAPRLLGSRYLAYRCGLYHHAERRRARATLITHLTRYALPVCETCALAKEMPEEGRVLLRSGDGTLPATSSASRSAEAAFEIVIATGMTAARRRECVLEPRLRSNIVSKAQDTGQVNTSTPPMLDPLGIGKGREREVARGAS